MILARDAEERRLTEKWLDGSEEAFETLVNRYAPRVIRFAYQLLLDWEEARDISQETFTRAHLCRSQLDPSRPLIAWLHTIAVRLAITELRHRRIVRRELGSLEGMRSTGEPAGFALREALGRLPCRQRQAVVLCDLHGYTAREAAGMIGCSASTVRVQRFLARQRMRELLGIAPAAVEPEIAE